MCYRFIAGVLLGIGCLWAQPEGPCSVSGTILNAITSEPVEGAEVTLIPGDAAAGQERLPFRDKSDARGRYAVRGLQPGRYVLVVRREGFENSYGPDGAASTRSTFLLERDAKEIVVRLLPNGSIGGRIEDQNGKPKPGAAVMAYRLSVMQGGKRLLQVGRDIADSEGRYRLPDLPAGKYYIVATEPDPESVFTYYPGTTNPDTAVRLDLSAGSALTNIDVPVAKVRTVCVRIRPERAVPGLHVVLSLRHPFAPGRIYNAALLNGVHQACGLLPGSYSAVAFLGSSSQPDYVARQTVEVREGDAQEFRLALTPAADVTVRIRVEGDGTPDLADVKVQLKPVERTLFTVREQTFGKAAEFTLKAVDPDGYRVNITRPPQGFYLKAIRSGTMDLLGKVLQVGGSSPEPVEIVLSPNVGNVNGTARNPAGDGAGAGVFVVLVPVEEERQGLEAYIGAAVAEASGAFAIPGMAPGEYRAVALERIEPQALLDQDVVKLIMAKGEKVEVREKSATSVQLKAIAAADFK